ncbi:MAG: exosome complex RNA-binding protein Rrp4 [Candidatus Pacearchaeota archaeon]|nr:exosome complex RNA-binding protein Rrp4 [Candidatus Pacearchaeota archaeon]
MNEEINQVSEEGYSSNDVKAKRVIVVPGEVIASGEDFLPGDGTYREGNEIIAERYGLSEIVGRVVKIIPLSGAYIPRRNNVVLGRVIDILHSGWLVDIDTAGSSFLPLAETPRFINKHEMNQFLDIGDMVSAKIWNVNGKSVDLAMKGKGLGKLEGGFVFRINPSRVPRVIGKEGSMISLIKENTGCNITIGQNGWVWIKGNDIDSEIKSRRAIEFIAEKVYVSGLTDKMEEWFNNN